MCPEVGEARVQILGEIYRCWMAGEGGISMIASSMPGIKPNVNAIGGSVRKCESAGQGSHSSSTGA